MSRIGKKPVDTNGVDVSFNGNIIVFKKGNNTRELDTKGNVSFSLDNGKLIFAAKGEARQDRAFWGTYRSISDGIIEGLNSGFVKSLELNGVGYKVVVKGNILEMSLGFSHIINYEFPKSVEVTVVKNTITVKGIDKQQVGQVAAEIRAFKPVEPYKGKGIKYSDERVIRKAGKSSVKK